MSYENSVLTPPPEDRAGSGLGSPAPDLDVLFAPRNDGYVGTDSAISVPLGPDRVLWLFGDTLLGSLESGRRTIRATAHNAAALQLRSQGIAPCKHFYLGDNEGRPDALLRLPGLHPEQWFWPGTAVMIDDGLFVFGYGVMRAPADCEALMFRLADSWVFHVLNPDDEPDGWEYIARPLFGRAGHAFFCSASWLHGDHLYLMGCSRSCSSDPNRPAAVLARIDAGSLFDLEAPPCLEFYVEDSRARHWSQHPGVLRELFCPGSMQSTLCYDAPRRRFIASTCNVMTPELKLSCAPEITGPWSLPMTVYTVGLHSPAESHLTYAPRLHLHLSEDADTLVMSYVVNACHPADLAVEPDIHYPRFIRLNLAALSCAGAV